MTRETMFRLVKDNQGLTLIGGMSTEICFAKYLSMRENIVYRKWIPTSIFSSGNAIEETLLFISDSVKAVSRTEHTALISPGMLSIPYVIELMDILYLPSQLLVAVKSIAELKELLTCANSKGIKCYAEIGYDGCMPDGLVAWIKFIELPQIYIDLLSFLKVRCCFTISIHNTGVKQKGENIARLYGEHESYGIRPGQLILVYINEGYGQNKDYEHTLFKSLVSDFEENLVGQEIDYIDDWESGIIDPYSFLSSFSGNKYCFTAIDTSIIYELSWTMSNYFMKLNGIKPKGIVLNPYFINNPRYECFYGYSGYCFWQHNPDCFKKLYSFIETRREPFEVWYNYIEGVNLNINLPITYLINIDNIDRWILDYKPNGYPTFKFLSMLDFVSICKKQQVDCFNWN